MTKPFDFERAKAGDPVCTRGGLRVRIIAFDRKDRFYPIVALVPLGDKYEGVESYCIDGKLLSKRVTELDLMMEF